ncbi:MULTISPECIES: tpaE [Streptomyces]|uniref:tpaE n=1 Tax=Streptomyces TaxID=1883 RepID=UPI001965135E|nr:MULTISPECIES: tpaE [Streptomyces]QRX93527.1 tpaE [Streptomyces noursei]UJB43205.1 tpaE [Streptomyces sp. A1-5]
MGVELKAETLGRAAGRDKQIAVPERPALRRGVRLRQVDDALMLDGADKRQVFTGKFAREDLGRLVAACDGSTTHAGIAAAVDLDEAVVLKSLALLWASGALEEGARPGDTPAVAPELACLLSRLGNSTGVNPSWADAAARLDRATVHLAGDSVLVQATARSVDGVCEVVEDLDELPLTDDALVVFFETRRSRPQLAELRNRCWLERRSLLRVRADGTSMTLGPYVDPAFTPCLECGVADEGDDLPDTPPQQAHDLIAGIVAHHLLALSSRAIRTYLPLDAGVIDLTTLSTRYRPSATRPGCPTCSFSKGTTASAPPPSAVYEASIALPVRKFLDTNGHLAHFQSKNMNLQWQFRDWPSCPRVTLPGADVSRLAGAPSPTADRADVGRPEVALMLAVAFGIRKRADGWVQRWTAAGGNIGSATAYLVSRDESVLPVGGYAYRERDHDLAQLTGKALPGERPLLLVVTANLKKMGAKYGTFGLRISFCDGGVALSAARKVADRLNLAYSLVTDWDDHALSAYLGLSTAEEPITAVMEVG